MNPYYPYYGWAVFRAVVFRAVLHRDLDRVPDQSPASSGRDMFPSGFLRVTASQTWSASTMSPASPTTSPINYLMCRTTSVIRKIVARRRIWIQKYTRTTCVRIVLTLMYPRRCCFVVFATTHSISAISSPSILRFFGFAVVSFWLNLCAHLPPVHTVSLSAPFAVVSRKRKVDQ